MKQVQYSRIRRRPFSYLFIRDFPVGALLIVCTWLVPVYTALAPPIQEVSVEKGGGDSKSVILQTCCPYQSQYNVNDGRCWEKKKQNALDDNDKNNDTAELTKFPEVFEVPDFLVSRAYRNVSWDKKFRLQQKNMQCPNGTIVVSLSLSPPINATPGGRRQMSKIAFTPVNGYLRHDFDIFYPDEFCINKLEQDELQIIACRPDCSEARPCVPKCCEIGQVWDLSGYPEGPFRCQYAGETLWTPQIYAEVKSKRPMNIRPHIYISHPRYWCGEEESTMHMLKPFMDEKKQPFRILRSGEIWYKFDRRSWASFTHGTYCVDGSFVAKDASNVGHYSGKYEDTIVWDCGPPLVAPKTSTTSQLYGISMLIAAFFLLLTIIVYILLWDKQNVHGWTLLCYFSSLFFMYVFYSAVHFSSMSLKQDSVYGGGTLCYVIGVCAHFFFLSSFCYMSTVNFDLWWTFRALMPTGGKSKGIRKFLAYNLFSLGIPTIIVAVGITLDHLYRDDPDSNLIVPEYGMRMCYLDRQYAALPYMHGPAGVLLCCNLVFFTVTVYAMYKIQQSTKFATMNSSKNANQKQSMILFIKLFLVMGLPWIFEVISSALQKGNNVPIFFQITDMINIFQAVAIWIIFVLKTGLYFTNRVAQKSFMLAITIRPERADSILRRHPRLRFIINPLTRSITSTRSFSTAKTTLSNGTEGSTSSRANVLGRRESDLDSTSSSSARSSPSGSLAGNSRGVKMTRKSAPESLEMR